MFESLSRLNDTMMANLNNATLVDCLFLGAMMSLAMLMLINIVYNVAKDWRESRAIRKGIAKYMKEAKNQ